MSDTQVVETTETEEIQEDTPETALMRAVAQLFGTALLTNSWLPKDKSDAEKARAIQFADDFRDFYKGIGRLSTIFNASLWAAHDNGTLPKSVEGTRDRRDPNADKPGRKAAQKSPMEKLFGRS